MTQKETIQQKLKQDGCVSRNWALKNYITRLGAIMNTLKEEGLKCHGDYEKTENGLDYVYRIKTSPQAKFGEINGLDDRLKEILSTIKPTWENRDKILELQRAINAKYNNKKLVILDKYQNKI